MTDLNINQTLESTNVDGLLIPCSGYIQSDSNPNPTRYNIIGSCLQLNPDLPSISAWPPILTGASGSDFTYNQVPSYNLVDVYALDSDLNRVAYGVSDNESEVDGQMFGHFVSSSGLGVHFDYIQIRAGSDEISTIATSVQYMDSPAWTSLTGESIQAGACWGGSDTILTHSGLADRTSTGVRFLGTANLHHTFTAGIKWGGSWNFADGVYLGALASPTTYERWWHIYGSWSGVVAEGHESCIEVTGMIHSGADLALAMGPGAFNVDYYFHVGSGDGASAMLGLYTYKKDDSLEYQPPMDAICSYNITMDAIPKYKIDITSLSIENIVLSEPIPTPTFNWIKQNIGTYGEGDPMPVNPNFVFSPDGQTIGFSNSGDIYLSYDSGASWEIYSGLKDAGYNSGLVALTNTPIMYVSGQRIYYRHDKSTGQTVIIKDTSDYYSGGARFQASETGQYVSMAVISGYNYRTANYYVSDDYGNNWSNPFSFDSAWDKSMKNTMDSTGQYQAVFATNEYVVPIGNLNYGHNCVHTSSDYGASWTKVLDLTSTDIPSFYAVEKGFEANYNNSTMCIAYTTGTHPNLTLNCHVTHDSGASWHNTTIKYPTGVNYGSYTMDYSGQYIIWASMYSLWGGAGPQVVISQDYGETWAATSVPPTSIMSIRPTEHEVWASFTNNTAAISTDWFNTWTSTNPFTGQGIIGTWLTKTNSDGTKFIVVSQSGGYAYTSTGNNIWEQATIGTGELGGIGTLAISGNGQYMLVGEDDGKVYLSNNGGTTWNEITPTDRLPDLEWRGAAINYSGQYMLIGDWRYDDLYFSNDYGVTWSLVNSGDGYTDGACISDNGSILVSGGWGGIFVSTDYGNSWTPTAKDFNDNLQGVACTALGDIIYLGDEGVYIWQSLDYGSTWTQLALNKLSNNLTCSDNNSIVLFADQTFGLLSSTDKLNWTLELPTMFDVSSDATGTRIICGQINGYVYISGSLEPINLDDIYSKPGHIHPYAPAGDYMINGHTIFPLNVRPTGSYYSSAGELGAGTGIPYVLRLANGGTVTLTVRGGIVTYIG